jgi:inner membrane protein
MDSVTHVVLGAAIGEVALGKKIGRWSLLVGAIAKSLPDFDLFYTGLKDTRAYVCYHRGHTHSLFWEALYALPLAWLLQFLFKKKIGFAQSYFFLLICLWGHSLLDWCTNYGTRLFLPFTNTPYSNNSIAILDLIFTLPILLLFLVMIFIKNRNFRFPYAAIILGYTFFYIGFCQYHKAQAQTIASNSLAQQGISAKHMITNPGVLNNQLWYGLAASDSTLYVTEFTFQNLLQPVKWLSYPRQTYLLDSCNSREDIATLNWFSEPFTCARKSKDTCFVFAPKFGRTDMRYDDFFKGFAVYYKLYQQNGVAQMGMHEPEINKDSLFPFIKEYIQKVNGQVLN